MAESGLKATLRPEVCVFMGILPHALRLHEGPIAMFLLLEIEGAQARIGPPSELPSSMTQCLKVLLPLTLQQATGCSSQSWMALKI